MLKLALVGKNIAHSKSQRMYEKILKEEVDYSLLDYDCADDISPAIKLLNKYQGISITSPYKEHFLSEVRVMENVMDLHAVNCLRLLNGKVEATNTDYLALSDIINKLATDKVQKFILLGNGAMARVCEKIFKEADFSCLLFSRKSDGDISKLDLSEHINSVVINSCARNYVFNGQLGKGSLFFDLNYAHQAHQLYFKDSRFSYQDGLGLLELQARYALDFWGF